jgi:hypothetical protein
MQKAWRDDPKYLDVEGAQYHYPSRYFGFINGFERFVYYRPSKGAPRGESSKYIGYGELGEWFPDPKTPTHRFVNVRKYRAFSTPVSYADLAGKMFEPAFANPNEFQGRSVRNINGNDYFRILATAGVYGDPFSDLADVDQLYLNSPGSFLLSTPPKQPFRIVDSIPDGTGYQPSGKLYADVSESAALQERARADHQLTLKAIQRLVHLRGGITLFNNNVDLFARVGEDRYLIEAKSVVDLRASVDRMRYGLGQLLDYGVRYRSELEGAKPILAFGQIPNRENSWISTILNENGVAFVGMRDADTVVALNTRAEALPLFA